MTQTAAKVAAPPNKPRSKGHDERAFVVEWLRHCARVRDQQADDLIYPGGDFSFMRLENADAALALRKEERLFKALALSIENGRHLDPRQPS